MGLGISKKEFRMMAVLLSGAFLAVLNATLMTPGCPPSWWTWAWIPPPCSG